jgi:hypothetical protein
MNLTASLQQNWQTLLAQGAQQCGDFHLEATTRSIFSRNRLPGTTLFVEQELRLDGNGSMQYTQLHTDGKGYIAPNAGSTEVGIARAAAMLHMWVRNMRTLRQLAVPRDAQQP